MQNIGLNVQVEPGRFYAITSSNDSDEMEHGRRRLMCVQPRSGVAVISFTSGSSGLVAKKMIIRKKGVQERGIMCTFRSTHYHI